MPAVDLVDGLEHREVPGKGRGVFATEHLAVNGIVLCNRPLAVAAKESYELLSFADNVISDASQVQSSLRPLQSNSASAPLC